MRIDDPRPAGLAEKTLKTRARGGVPASTRQGVGLAEQRRRGWQHGGVTSAATRSLCPEEAPEVGLTAVSTLLESCIAYVSESSGTRQRGPGAWNLAPRRWLSTLWLPPTAQRWALGQPSFAPPLMLPSPPWEGAGTVSRKVKVRVAGSSQVSSLHQPRRPKHHQDRSGERKELSPCFWNRRRPTSSPCAGHPCQSRS